jgi:hypothetical protein
MASLLYYPLGEAAKAGSPESFSTLGSDVGMNEEHTNENS